MAKPLIIGSRGSDLALWQANYILKKLEELEISAEILVIKTQGDLVQDLSFDKMEGKGFFTKELEEALLKGDIDLAVHSYKDLETNQPKGLKISAVTIREEPNDMLLINKNAVDEKRRLALKEGAIVGTSSARRKSFIRGFRKDIELKNLRGNVPTRIKKLKKGSYDAILLAAAGVNRLDLDLSDFHVELLDPTEFVPAPAQGVLALQIRSKDKKLHEQLQSLNDEETATVTEIERGILNKFGGGCQLPIGVYCRPMEEGGYEVWTARANSADEVPQVLYTETRNPDKLGERLVAKFKDIEGTSVFITRDLRQDDCFENLLVGNGFKVNGQSMIETNRVEVRKDLVRDDFTWIFFSSMQAIYHYFGQFEPRENVKYGVIGKPTAAALRKRGFVADFIGYSTDTRLTGKQFASVVGSEVVLFPMARGSRRTIQEQFTGAKQVINLVVYATVSHEDVTVAASRIVVFTSPSNVKSYIKSNPIRPSQRLVALGNATGHELIQNGIEKFTIPSSFSDVSLAQAVFAVSATKKES
ncbi:MAG: hydroxymethylbilane synthase [Flavobacteriales bacterium]|nr:hydroxymethylbilane synthase [Flavobacteriales bacterium]